MLILLLERQHLSLINQHHVLFVRVSRVHIVFLHVVQSRNIQRMFSVYLLSLSEVLLFVFFKIQICWRIDSAIVSIVYKTISLNIYFNSFFQQSVFLFFVFLRLFSLSYMVLSCLWMSVFIWVSDKNSRFFSFLVFGFACSDKGVKRSWS